MTLQNTMLFYRVQSRHSVEAALCLRWVVLQAVALQTTHRSAHNIQGSVPVMQSHEVLKTEFVLHTWSSKSEPRGARRKRPR